MPRVPRSMSRVSPPVCRSRWKRSDSECMCSKTSSATRRMARCATFTNTTSRSSLKSVRGEPQDAVGREQRQRHGEHRLGAGEPVDDAPS